MPRDDFELWSSVKRPENTKDEDQKFRNQEFVEKS